MAVLAPIPRARESRTEALKPGRSNHAEGVAEGVLEESERLHAIDVLQDLGRVTEFTAGGGAGGGGLHAAVDEFLGC